MKIYKWNDFNEGSFLENKLNEGLWDKIKGYLSNVEKFFTGDPKKVIDKIDPKNVQKIFDPNIIKTNNRVILNFESEDSVEVIMLQRLGSSANYVIFAELFKADGENKDDENKEATTDKGDVFFIKPIKINVGKPLEYWLVDDSTNGLKMKKIKTQYPLKGVIYQKYFPKELTNNQQ